MQTNLAYDLARFDVDARQKAVKDSPEVNELKMIKPRRKKASPFKGVVAALSAIAVCGSILYMHVMINESYNQIATEKRALDAAISEECACKQKLIEICRLRTLKIMPLMY